MKVKLGDLSGRADRVGLMKVKLWDLSGRADYARRGSREASPRPTTTTPMSLTMEA
jgi:hypothetical protein